ncbi:hypothetical protein BpHYR1_034623, partial [Brachionus plicatilis]
IADFKQVLSVHFILNGIRKSLSISFELKLNIIEIKKSFNKAKMEEILNLALYVTKNKIG